MPDRALVTGASGLLGRQVLQAFEQAGWEAFGTGYSRPKPPQILKVDIQNEHEVLKVLDDVHPQVLVHCAADRQPDSCTRNPEGARMLNVVASENLARLCSARNCFLIYISTDYVFPGQPGQAPFTADSKPAPTNVYGQTKLDGENAVLDSSTAGTSVVLRVPVLYGPTEPADNNKESAVNILMDALHKSQKEKIVMDDYAIRYPTNTEDVGRVCVDITKLYTGKKDTTLPRILQFTSEDRMTKYEIVQKFAEIMGLPIENVVPDAESGKKPAADGTLRPYDCHLSTQELRAVGVDVNTVDFVAWWRKRVGAYRH